MLIRVKGGTKGIREYLETGRKQDRDESRDELDERVLLAGDIAITEATIDSMTTRGEKYLHATLSFREDDVSFETLQAVTEEFRQFAFAAYRDDEYAFYAEAHLPRLKSFVHQRTGELVERKPHIHIVIPEQNLLSDTRLHPFGRVSQNLDYIDAFQETVNRKYGLASPKDHRRTTLLNQVDIVSRHTGDFFTGLNREIKEQILEHILTADIRNTGELRCYLESIGDVRIRNEGKINSYLNLRTDPDSKGVNLKEYVFSLEFLSLSKDEKARHVADQSAISVKETGTNPQVLADRKALLDRWFRQRSLELKYLNSGNRAQYTQYQEASEAERSGILQNLRERFYDRYDRLPESQTDIEIDGKEADRSADEDEFNRYREPSDENQPESPAEQIFNRNQQEFRERSEQSQSEWTVIKRNLRAEFLLSELKITHGIRPEKYQIERNELHGDRIVCGSRRYNVADFLTKELHLSWSSASKILRDVYEKQETNQKDRIHEGPLSERLRLAFDHWRGERFNQVSGQRERRYREYIESLRDIREWYWGRRSAISGDRSLRIAAKRTARSLAAMQRVVKEAHLQQVSREARNQDRRETRKSYSELLQDFLVELANKGDQEALAELRSTSRSDVSVSSDVKTGFQIRVADSSKTESKELFAEGWDFLVHRNGEVTYQSEGREILCDAGRVVYVLQIDDDTIEKGLRLAVAKFGKSINLEGPDEFKAMTVRIAVERRIAVSFDDPVIDASYQILKHQFEKGTGTTTTQPTSKEHSADTTPDINSKAEPRSRSKQSESGRDL